MVFLERCRKKRRKRWSHLQGRAAPSAGLINDVLDLSKIEAGQLSLALSDYSTSSIVDWVVASTGSLARAKGIDVRAVETTHLPRVVATKRRSDTSLLNLVGNAIKFTEPA